MWLQESERYNSRAAPTRRPSLSLAGLDLSGSGNRGVDVPPPRFSVVLDAMSDIFGAVRIENQDKVRRDSHRYNCNPKIGHETLQKARTHEYHCAVPLR